MTVLPQEIALNSEMSQTLRINLHILAITFANFVSCHSNVPGLFQYVKQVCTGPRSPVADPGTVSAATKQACGVYSCRICGEASE